MVDVRTSSLQVSDGGGAAVTSTGSAAPLSVVTSTSIVHRDVVNSAVVENNCVGSEDNRSRNRSVTEHEREGEVKSTGGNGTAAARTLKGLAVKNVSQQGIDFISS